MKVFLASAVIFGLAVLGMAVGTIFGKRGFRGSCRGTCERCDEGATKQCKRSEESSILRL